MITTFGCGDLPPPDRSYRAALEIAADMRRPGPHDDHLILRAASYMRWRSDPRNAPACWQEQFRALDRACQMVEVYDCFAWPVQALVLGGESVYEIELYDMDINRLMTYLGLFYAVPLEKRALYLEPTLARIPYRSSWWFEVRGCFDLGPRFFHQYRRRKPRDPDVAEWIEREGADAAREPAVTPKRRRPPRAKKGAAAPVPAAASVTPAAATPTVSWRAGPPTAYLTPTTVLAADAVARASGYAKTLDPRTLAEVQSLGRASAGRDQKYPVIAARPLVRTAGGRESVVVRCLVADGPLEGRSIDMDAGAYLELPQGRFELVNPWVCDPDGLLPAA